MSTERVAFVVLHVDGDVARGMSAAVAERDDVGIGSLRRPTLTNETATIISLLTGVGPQRHDGHTRLVPAQGETEGLDERLVEADLRPRTARDLGAPAIWNRLASRGVVTAAIGWPLVETQDDDHVLELGMRSLLGISAENEVLAAEAMLGAIRGGIEARPDIACLCLYGWFREAPDDDGAGDGEANGDGDPGEDDGDDETPSADQIAQRKAAHILGWLDAVRHVSEAKHVVAVLVAPRVGRYLVMGPMASDWDGGMAMTYAAVPTVLALLGEPPAGDLQGRSFLDVGDTGAAAAAPGWSIEGGPLSPPDFEPAIRRVIEGDGGPLLRQVVVRVLTQRHWVGISEGDPAAAVEAGRRLLEIEDSPVNHLRTALALLAAGETAEAVRQVERLRAAHPESVLGDLATTLQPMKLDDDKVAEVLDRIAFEDLPGPLPRGVWARAAARIGRDDEAIDALWRLIIAGYALHNDRLNFASLAVKRNHEGDARRAVLATRGMTGLAAGREGRPRIGVALLRARALHLAGNTPAAIALLERFVEHHPLEEQAVAMLKKLKESGE